MQLEFSGLHYPSRPESSNWFGFAKPGHKRYRMGGNPLLLKCLSVIRCGMTKVTYPSEHHTILYRMPKSQRTGLFTSAQELRPWAKTGVVELWLAIHVQLSHGICILCLGALEAALQLIYERAVCDLWAWVWLLPYDVISSCILHLSPPFQCNVGILLQQCHFLLEGLFCLSLPSRRCISFHCEMQTRGKTGPGCFCASSETPSWFSEALWHNPLTSHRRGRGREFNYSLNHLLQNAFVFPFHLNQRLKRLSK